MFNLKRIKKYVNPLNSIITGVIILFIGSRVILNNHENAFVIDEIIEIESLSEQRSEHPSEHPSEYPSAYQTQQPAQEQTQQPTEQITITVTNENPQSSTSNPSISTASSDEPLAYSAELDKTFTLDAFNQLSKEDLMTFTGIGEVTAQAILDYRQDHGPFGQFEDLMLVKGIGEKKLQKIMMILP